MYPLCRRLSQAIAVAAATAADAHRNTSAVAIRLRRAWAARVVHAPAEKDATGRPQHGPSGQDRGQDEDGRDPWIPDRGGAVLDQAFAQEHGEGREAGQGEAAQGEQEAGPDHVAPAPAQVVLVDAVEAAPEDADAQE